MNPSQAGDRDSSHTDPLLGARARECLVMVVVVAAVLTVARVRVLVRYQIGSRNGAQTFHLGTPFDLGVQSVIETAHPRACT